MTSQTDSLLSQFWCWLLHIRHTIHRTAPPWVAVYCYTCKRWRGTA